MMRNYITHDSADAISAPIRASNKQIASRSQNLYVCNFEYIFTYTNKWGTYWKREKLGGHCYNQNNRVAFWKIRVVESNSLPLTHQKKKKSFPKMRLFNVQGIFFF